MQKQIPVAKAGDVCVLVEPTPDETGQLQNLQQLLQARFGGRLHQRPHFTCQRFSPDSDHQLIAIVEELRVRLAAVPPLPVMASELVLAEHPFWQFSVLRWDLHLTETMHHFAGLVGGALEAAGLAGHYPLGDAWSPHVTALEQIYQNGHRPGVQSPSRQLLYTGRQVVFSQIRPGKQFEIVATIPLTNLQARVAPGPVEYFPRYGGNTRP